MKNDPKARIDAVRVALQDLGSISSETISTFVSQRFGLDIPPAIVPLIRAIIEDRDRLDARRAASGSQKEQQASDDAATQPSLRNDPH